MDGWMDGGESVSPWQPITSDPTPRTKGWRDERMDGDEDDDGVWEERRRKHRTRRNIKEEEERNTQRKRPG